jgi:hypothetical protein
MATTTLPPIYSELCTLTIASNNYNGRLADITFYSDLNPSVGVDLGSHFIPYTRRVVDAYGRYKLYFPTYCSSCEVRVFPRVTTTTLAPVTTTVNPLFTTTASPTTTTAGPSLCIYPNNIVSTNAIYSQSSIWNQNLAATAESMNNRQFNETLYTGTNSGTQWIKMDLGINRNIRNIIVGCDFYNTLEFGWGKFYTENKKIQYSIDNINWIEAADTGIFTSECKVFSVSINARYIRLFSTNSYLAATEFAAGI